MDSKHSAFELKGAEASVPPLEPEIIHQLALPPYLFVDTMPSAGSQTSAMVESFQLGAREDPALVHRAFDAMAHAFARFAETTQLSSSSQ